jgi:biopolymer transport protein ExbD
MRIRHVGSRSGDKIELQMTPMIDVVFQLLIFFLLTFRIVSMEGDFNIKMPRAAPREGLPDPTLVPPMLVRLRADAKGDIVGIALNDTPYGNYDALRNRIIELVGTGTGPGSVQETAEVEFDCDFNLRYEETIKAITAVSGYVGDDGKPVKLVEKIKFKQTAAPEGDSGT